jgi:chorismate mutase-like protein
MSTTLEHNGISLQQLRDDIDRVDAELLHLLNQRAKLVQQVGNLKKHCAAPVVHTDRERALLERLHTLNAGPLPNAMLDTLFQNIIDTMKQLQR